MSTPKAEVEDDVALEDAELATAPAPAMPAVRAKPLTRRLPAAREVPALVPDLVPARMVNEVLYCERLMYLEWVQGEFADNYFTVDGRAVHQRPDQGKKPLKPPRGASGKGRASGERGGDGTDREGEGEGDTDAVESPQERPYTARSVWLSSERLGLTAKIDVVDVDETGKVVIPVEYKRGKQPDVPERAYLPERAQLCAQVLLLREHGFTCERADIYFAADRRRVTIDISADLIATTERAIARAKELAAQAELPSPLADSPKCNGCSLVGICLPDEVSLLEGSPANDASPTPSDEAAPQTAEEDEDDPWGLRPAAVDQVELRRLHPARDDRVPLLVQDHGARVSLDGERFVVRSSKGAAAVEARVPNTSEIALFGNVYLTTPALRMALDRGIPVSYFSYGGWFLGRAIGFDTKNVELRLAQYAGATDPAVCLAIAKGLVASKILNCRTMLRRNQETADAVALFELKQLARKALAAESLASLLGLEGTAARVYFGGFTAMLRGDAAADGTFDLEGRNRRPPRDPVNALLSFCYALLSKDFALTLATVGLDPLLGFYHQPRFGRPALALDLMEEFRPLIADSVVISAINNGVVVADDFIHAAGAVALKPAARKRLILAYERRMDHLVTHPVFGYRISYRRVLEVQARLLGRYLLGEIPRYPAFRTR